MDAPGRTAVRSMDTNALPDGTVAIDILYSGINYKDALAVTGGGKIIRAPFPFVPGIDFAGYVAASRATGFAVGDAVVQTGGGCGETFWGGYAQRQHITPESLVKLPDELSLRSGMVIGTAGVTAMLAVMALEAHGLEAEAGEVVVTGASGGVGSFAVALLAGSGYRVVASTGTTSAAAVLTALGASRIIYRDDLGGGPRRPLGSARYAGAVDTLGGPTLAAVVSRLARHGCVAACGNVAGADLKTSVYPFILRGVSVLGIDSNHPPMDVRRAAWQRLATSLPMDIMRRIRTGVIPLESVPAACNRLLNNETTGRVVVDVNA